MKNATREKGKENVKLLYLSFYNILPFGSVEAPCLEKPDPLSGTLPQEINVVSTCFLKL